MQLTPKQRKKVDAVYIEAKARQDEMWEQIDRLEAELSNVKCIYERARFVECNAVNMMNGVEPFDEKNLELK